MVREQSFGDGRSTIIETIHSLILGCVELDPGALTDDAGLRTGTWNSLEHLSVLMAVSKRFGFPLSPQVVRDVNTVGDLVRHTMEVT